MASTRSSTRWTRNTRRPPPTSREGTSHQADRQNYRSLGTARRTSPAPAPTHQGAQRIPRGPRRPAEDEGEVTLQTPENRYAGLRHHARVHSFRILTVILAWVFIAAAFYERPEL